MKDKKKLLPLLAVGVVGVALLTTRAKAEEQPPPPVQYNFVCFWSDGFKTVTWEEMLEHYRTAHPDEPLINFVEVVWV